MFIFIHYKIAQNLLMSSRFLCFFERRQENYGKSRTTGTTGTTRKSKKLFSYVCVVSFIRFPAKKRPAFEKCSSKEYITGKFDIAINTVAGGTRHKTA